ncbi:hypothetical protein H7683_16140 [Ectopseudomonas mendocina]|uniref:hypothetical protein n=1 Tax=Ectopseudomonas mendocina TaxID=300 RepID=UPI001AE0245C|nr:hypothetical protein [Pseudomonas mendocina]QTN44514.1 hypothetical protein H7683_16140 [Pseudomonas mendocina]
MSQTFTAALPCHRAGHCTDASSRPNSVFRTGFVAFFAHALACCSEDRLLIPVHD